MGGICSLSLGMWDWCSLFGMPLFEFLDWFTANCCLPIGAFLTCLFIGWYVEHKVVHDEITNWGTTNVRFVHLFVLAVKYICPLFILFVFFHQLGWI
jgi:NSS family neurotransmitter:Na+ symporter